MLPWPSLSHLPHGSVQAPADLPAYCPQCLPSSLAGGLAALGTCIFLPSQGPVSLLRVPPVLGSSIPHPPVFKRAGNLLGCLPPPLPKSTSGPFRFAPKASGSAPCPPCLSRLTPAASLFVLCLATVASFLLKSVSFFPHQGLRELSSLPRRPPYPGQLLCVFQVSPYCLH